MGEIETRTSTTTIKNKAIKLENARREKKTCKEGKGRARNNVDYGKTFILALFISVDDDGWYVNFGTIMHLFYK